MGSFNRSLHAAKIRKDIEKREKLMAGFNNLGCCKQAPISPPAHDQVMEIMGQWHIDCVANMPQKKETTMNTDTRTEAQQAKDYLIESARLVARDKKADAQKAFKTDYTGVHTVGELKQAIKGGWFQMVPEAEKMPDDYHLWNLMDVLVVMDPEKTPDLEGYKTACKAVDAYHSDVKDQIVVMGPEKGLEALNAFKAKTFH